VFNIGMGEIAVIAILGLLVFGPDRLPKAVKSLSAGLRAIRASASDATRSLQDAAGWDDGQTRQAMDDLASLHPKRLMGSILDDAPKPDDASGRGRAGGASRPGRLGDFDPDAP
jgi:sec-independent protein translocase protein TatB